jgi:hypothetical protein
MGVVYAWHKVKGSSSRSCRIDMTPGNGVLTGRLAGTIADHTNQTGTTIFRQA